MARTNFLYVKSLALGVSTRLFKRSYTINTLAKARTETTKEKAKQNKYGTSLIEDNVVQGRWSADQQQ